MPFISYFLIILYIIILQYFGEYDTIDVATVFDPSNKLFFP